MLRDDTLFDLVEHAAVRELIPRLELWEETAKALIDGDLPAANLLDGLSPRTTPKTSIGRGWLRQFLEAVERGSDPSSFKHILKLIIVRKRDFEKWRNKTSSGRRGPLPKTTGYQDRDLKLCPHIKRLVDSGQARSGHDAAMQLGRAGKIPGTGSLENKAKRVSQRYLRYLRERGERAR